MATVQVIATQAVRPGDGQAPTSNHLHDSPNLGLCVAQKLEEADYTCFSVCVKCSFRCFLCKTATLLSLSF